MLVIRLQRIGKKHQASFRIVLQESQWKPQGKTLELLGFYNPHSKEKNIQTERVKYWIAKGAQPSATLHNMFIDLGVVAGEKTKVWKAKKGSVSEVKPEIKSESAPVVEPVTESKEEIAPVENTGATPSNEAQVAA
ncbi:MAG: 30S ribosomal protein S16 [bacterium]|nr:30S ribosomal protein S16 [bacterium]